MIISGRDLGGVRQMATIDGLAYGGGHGFDIVAACGSRVSRRPRDHPNCRSYFAYLAPSSSPTRTAECRRAMNWPSMRPPPSIRARRLV